MEPNEQVEQPQTEIIARKAKQSYMPYVVLVLSIVTFIIGALYFFVFSVSEEVAFLKWFLGIGGMVIGVLGIMLFFLTLVRYRKMPDILITREGNTLFILGQPCEICDITDINYIVEERGGGNVTVIAGDKKFKCGMIEKVWDVDSRLLELMKEYKTDKEQ